MLKNNHEKIQAKLKNARATLAVEGMELSKKDEELLIARHEGEITEKEFLKKARELAKYN